jgi:sugar transferase (PEP-CTERM/EpsH1 system associated)
MRILWITDKIPYPPVSGTLLRIYHMCRRIASEHEMWLISPVNNAEEEANAEHMRAFCHRVITIPRPHQSKLSHLPGLMRYLVEGKPLELKFEQIPAMEQQVYDLSRQVDFDIIHITPSYLGLYREMLPRTSRSKLFIEFHNVEADLFAQLAALEKRTSRKLRLRLHSTLMHRWEPAIARQFDHSFTMSEIDKRRFLELEPTLSISAVPNGVDTDGYQILPEPAANGLLFIGSMSYAPCADGAVWFCNAILPQVQPADAEMWVVGRSPGPDVQALASDKVHVTGWVEDILPYYERTRIAVVPLRAGSGTRLKILEAMALGRAVVSTTIGAEGLAVHDGEHLFIADDPQTFAEKVSRLLQDDDLRRAMVLRARELVVNHYDWKALARQMIGIYEAVLHQERVSP